ncbi:hypothetical protein ITP53_46105 [Nonomuraea sp. K274]|uniref:Uncharacterized protein n=1 Tax=Nonomuraea cypriaca TaxID=1187855 RepID=A0A931AHG2_9ACTN|nr:hypothetical protein [Nonomuraea cypriaca]MBF8192931.1 hypothetical protein [Nonomuraea cypriaca]
MVLLAGGSALAVAGALGAAWLWLPGPPGQSSTAVIATTPSPSTSHPVTGQKEPARALRPPSRPHPSKTATTTAPPTKEPTEEPAKEEEPSPTSKPATKKPAGGVTSVAFDYEGIRVGDCWRADTNIWAKVSATGSYTYRWIVNGQNQGREIGTSSSKPLLPSITWKGEGTYRVVFEVVSPNHTQKSLTVPICDGWDGW